MEEGKRRREGERSEGRDEESSGEEGVLTGHHQEVVRGVRHGCCESGGVLLLVMSKLHIISSATVAIAGSQLSKVVSVSRSDPGQARQNGPAGSASHG